MKTLGFTLLLLCFFTALPAVTWLVGLTDSFGDGWNGGTLTVMVNGATVLNGVTLTTGYGPIEYSITINHGDRITTTYTPGDWSYENEYYFRNHVGVTVLINGEGNITPTSIEDTFMCEVLTPFSCQVGSGSYTGQLPVYPYYGYTYSQSIYLRSELPATLGSRRIAKLKYHWNGATVASHTLNWRIHIGHTSRTQFNSTTDWVPLAELTEVFEGNVHLLATPGWVEIILDRPFDYDGTSNLVVAVEDNTELYDGSAGRFNESLVTNFRSLVYFNDYINPEPGAPPTASYRQSRIPNIIFQMDPMSHAPFEEDFPVYSIPMAWAQFRSSAFSSDRWYISNSSMAGGEPYEMKASWVSGVGVTRLISPAIPTMGVSTLYLSFDHFFMDYGPGITGKLQISHDMNTWTDTGWSFTSGGGDVSGPVSIPIDPGTANFTYLAWTLEGNHYSFDYWYVDNVQVNIPALDARPIVIETEAVHNQTFTPRAIVRNNSSQPLTFYVTFTIGNLVYSSTQLVTDLPANTNQTVVFADYSPDLSNYVLPIRVTTHLLGDTEPSNDQLAGSFACLDLDRQAFVDAHHYSDTGLKGPTSFNLKTPETVTHLGSPSSAGLFMAGADWIGNRWYTSEYDSGSLTTDNFWWINHLNGVQTLIGESGTSLHGIAWDPNHEILYGTDTENLYTVDPATGAATLVGSHGGGLSFMIGIAYNDYTDILYGVDLETDALYTIDTNTGLATLVGPLGISINFGQDLAFDRLNGHLFLAGYLTDYDYGPRLYWINCSTGEALKIGNFPVDYQMVGFAIPSGVVVADLRILPDRTLEWDPIPGVSEYRIYGYSSPYGVFSYLGSTPSTSWIEPGNPQEMRFYMITAVYARSEEAPPIRYVTEYKDPLTGELLDPQPEIPVQESHQLPEISSETPSVGATRE